MNTGYFKKILLLTVLSIIALATNSFADTSKKLEIVSNGKSSYNIVIPDTVDKRMIMTAADLLQSIIEKSSGTKLSIVKESEHEANKPGLYLGKSTAAGKAGITLDKLTGWSCVNRTIGNSIFIVGDDARDSIKNSKAVIEHLGTLKGVIMFLENQMGARFLLPGEYGRRIPKHSTITIDADMDDSFTPTFIYTTGRAPKDKILATAINLFGRTPVLRTYGGHSYYSAVPKKKYAKTHPAYFALRGGIRETINNHLCISNPEVQELMLEEMEQELDKGYEWVELAQTDGYKACECDKCKAIHPDEAERLWIVHRKLAFEMKRRCPGKKVMIPSYGPTSVPPKSFDSFPDNVVIQMCSYTPEAFDEWKKYNVTKSAYIYNWGDYKAPGFSPMRSPLYVVEQIRRFVRNKVKGIYICGGFEPFAGYGLSGPSFYAFGKALGDQSIDPAEIQDEFIDTLFEESAVPMRAFYKKMYQRLDAFSVFDRPNIATGNLANSMNKPEDFFCHCFPTRTLKNMTVNLDRAKNMAESDQTKSILQMVEYEFNFVKNIANSFHVYRAYRANPTAVMLNELARTVSKRQNSVSERYNENGKCTLKLQGGLPLFFSYITEKRALINGRKMGLEPPFSWDFENLQKNGILPGSATLKKIIAKTVSPFNIDGDISKAVWAKIPSQELNEIGMGKKGNASRFKIAYGKDALYMAFECECNSADWKTHLKKTGRDGAAWGQESIEILIDPWAEREKHYQIVFSPMENSTFDSRRGNFGDPLDPLYGKTDSTWNGDWNYAFNIDNDNKRWTAEIKIPYETLGVSPPEPGTLWVINVGRSEWPGGYKNSKPRYSTWSPNLEGRNFHDRSSFGELIFK